MAGWYTRAQETAAMSPEEARRILADELEPLELRLAELARAALVRRSNLEAIPPKGATRLMRTK
jgi:hypothetical protein